MTSTPPAIAHQHDQTINTTNSSSFRGCCCCLFLLLSILTLLIVAAILVIVLAVKPQKPHFDLQKVRFQYMGISPVTTTQSAAAAVSLIIHMFFVATNDNKVGIKYNEFWFTVMYHGIPLGRGAVPGFYQPAHDVRLVETTIFVDRVNFIQANASYMLGEASPNDRVTLRVVGEVGARIRILGLTSPRVQFSVDCTIAFSPTRQTLISKQCGFDGLRV